MRKWSSFAAGLAVAAAGLVGPRPATAQPVLVPVALTGTAATAGGTYTQFHNPVVNDSGQVAYFAFLSGTSTRGLFVGTPGAVQVVARNNTPAPAGGTYNFDFSDPVLNAAGQVAFTATLSGTSTQGVFVGAPGAVQAAALQGSAAPAGGTYNGFGSVVLNAAGRVAFNASLTGGSSTGGDFVGTPGAVQPLALANTPAPAGGGTYSQIAGLTLNAAGQSAFPAFLTGGPATSGMFVGAPGTIQAAAFQGVAAPGGGGNYSGFHNPTLNATGQLAFFAFLTGGPSGHGLFAGGPGSVQAVALLNTPAPAGGNYTGVLNSGMSPAINGSGQVAFVANLTGGSSTGGVFVGAPGSIQPAALAGTTAPSGLTFTSFSVPELNGAGQLAFIASLSGAGVTTANDFALFAGPVGGLVQVVREGDQIDVDPGPSLDLRTVANNGIGFAGTVSGGQDGFGVAFSDSGILAVNLTFTDGSSGVFVTSTASVPEPTALALVAAAAGAAGIVRLVRRPGSRPRR